MFFEVDGLLCSTIVGKYDVNLLVGLKSLIVLDDNFHTSRCLYGILCCALYRDKMSTTTE